MGPVLGLHIRLGLAASRFALGGSMKYIWTDRHGQEFITDPESDRYNDPPNMAHHRIIAYAHGLLEHPYERVEIDHEIEIPWLNYEANLERETPGDHARKTRKREWKRKNGLRKV